jgi:hypothetical protein
MTRKALEEQLDALARLAEQPPESWIALLQKALRQRNNYLVAKAAAMVESARIEVLLPDLLTAYSHFFENASKSDPQCWAKNALSKALAALELQEPEPFLRGLRHVQMEPVWGGQSDTAGSLRGTCALALVQCRGLSEITLLRYLLDVMVDADKVVRCNAVRAIEQVGSHAASLLLRLRAQLGSDEAEVLGACYSGVLRLEGVAALPWAQRFLAAEDDAAGEAALAMAETHSTEAFTILKQQWEQTRDLWFGSVLLSAIALTRQHEATEFLLDMVRKDARGSSMAVEALLRAMPSEDVIEKLRSCVAGNPQLERIFKENARPTERQ